MYRKAGMKIEALNTLVERIEDFDRAHEYATKVDDPATWSTLGHAQLARGHVNDAIGSYLLAKDSSKCVPPKNPCAALTSAPRFVSNEAAGMC